MTLKNLRPRQKRTYLCSMKILKLIPFVIIVAFIGACEDEFTLIDDYKEIPIVYGLLSLNDTAAHYIRVERAFVDESKDALEIAQIADSLYFKDINVQLVRKSTGDVFNLTMVDGNLEGLPREDGVFATSPNYLYKINAADLQLVGNEDYKIVIRHDGSEDILTEAETKIVGAYQHITNSPSDSVNFNGLSVTFGWKSSEQSATFYEFNLVMHYDETDPQNPTQMIPKEITWNVDDKILRDESNNLLVAQTYYTLSGSDFFKFFRDALDPLPGISRKFRSFDLVINSGSNEILSYLNAGQANTGLTGTLTIPSYTNLSNGYGLFASRHSLIKEGFVIHKATRDSLAGGQYTFDLNFQ